jgi:hypothetical protein
MLTRRERLTRCYNHQELDRPAVYSRAGFPDDDPSYDRLKAYLWEKTELKFGWRGVSETPYPTDTATEPCSADFERRVTVLRTPAGDLRSSYLVSLRGQPGLQESYFLKSRQDAETYLSLPVPEASCDAASFPELERKAGDQGIVDVSLGFNPAGFVVELFGSEAFALMSVTDRDILHALCERQMRIVMNRARLLLSRGVGPFFSMAGEEYLVPPLHGPRDFHDFNVKYDRPILDLIHDGGGRVHIHCHGSIRKVLQGFLDMGTDVLHPFEAPPMGDVLPGEAKAVVRGRMSLEGNIQINRLYEATPEEVRQETEALIAATFGDRRGLIVCPTASPYIRGEGEACFPQYKAMIDAVLEWRG